MIRYIRSDLALSGSKLINTIGKSLYNHIESAFDYAPIVYFDGSQLKSAIDNEEFDS